MLKKIQNFAARCLVKSFRIEKGIALCQIQDGTNQELKIVPMLQQWGLASVPTVDSMGVALRIGGERRDSIVIATDSKERPALKSGETAIYSDKWIMKLTDDGVSISAKSGQEIFKVKGDKITSSVPFEAAELRSQTDVLAGSTSLKTHIHTGGTIEGKTGIVAQ